MYVYRQKKGDTERMYSSAWNMAREGSKGQSKIKNFASLILVQEPCIWAILHCFPHAHYQEPNDM